MLKSLFPWKHNKTKRAMAVQQTMEEELILQEQNLVPCHVCGRTFLPNPLKKHEKVCEKNALKKRKPFDSLKQRVEGTELAAFHQKSYLKKTVEPQEQKRSRSSKWKEKHLELVTAIRAAKGIPNEMQSRSPKAKNTTLTERCPSCDRHFGPKAYDRHVEWCTERKARIQQSPASVQKAKEMLEARIKYRVPPLNKSKRARVREKYSTTPNDSETASVKSVGSNLSLLSTSFSRGPSVRKPKSLVNVSKVNDQKNVEKLDLERGSGDKVKQEHVKCVLPDIGTPGTKTELANSAFANGAFIKGNLTGKKISSVIVNDQICDMIMSPKMVTWKDTTQNNSEEFVPQTKRTYFQMHKRKTVYLSSNSVKSVQNIAKDVVECAIDNSKPQVEKILSSSDILHKSKIPTNWAFKKVTEVLRKYKKRTPKLKDVNSKDTKNKEHCSFTDIPESKEVRVRSVEPIEKVSDISFVGRNSESISTDNREFESVYRQILDVRLDLAEVTGCRKGVEFLNADTEVFIPNHSSDVDMAKEIRIGRAEEMHSKEKASFGDGVSDISGLKEVMSCSSGDNRVSPNSRAQINNTEANELLALEGSWKASGKRQNNMLLPLNPLNSVNSLTDETSETSDKAKMQNIMWQPLNPLNIDKRQNNAWKPLNSVKSFTGEGRETSDKDERQHNIWTALNPLNSESSETYPFRCLFEKTLNVSNKRSCSDVALNKSSKNSLVSIYLNKRDGDSESIENVTASGSLPNLSLEYYNIEKFREHRVQKVKTAAHTASDGGENYSVPKKKMRLCSSSTSLTLSFRNESAMSKCSATSAVSPRVRELVGKILKGRSLRSDDNEVILGITLSECEKLIRMSGEQFARVAKRFAKDRVKLPLVVVDGAERSVTKRDEGVQVEIESKGVDFKLPFIGSTRRHKETKDDSPTPNYDPFDVAQRQFMELLDSDNFKPFAPFNSQVTRPHTSNPNPIKTPTSPQVAPKTVKSADPIKKYNRASVIDPPSNFKDSLDSVNDDFELMENLINEHFNADDKNFHDNGYYLHNLKNDKRSLTLDHILDNRKYSDDASSIDPCLINENDNLSIPDHFKVDDYSPTYTEITVQNDDVDQYSVQYDAKIEAIEPKIAKKPIVKRSVSLVSRSKKDTNAVGKVSVKKPSLECKKSSKSVCSVDRGEKTKTLPLLKRSITLFDPSSPKTSFKNKKQVNELSEEREQKCTKKTGHHNARSTPKKADTPILDAFKAEELFAVDDEMYEEYKKFEEMYLKEKEQKANPRRNKKGLDLNCGLFAPSTEESETPNVNGKISYDSAYGSLTRKTTRHKSRSTKLTPLDQKQAESGSSSSSENGPNSPLVVSDVSKVSKFCHECGTRFPVSTAKFCVECGIRRLVL